MAQTHITTRCAWSGTAPFMIRYHGQEWRVAIHDDRILSKALFLDSTQSGLSWLTILRKRENYRQAFDNFDVTKVAELLQDMGIVRNELKVASAVANAQTFLLIQLEFTRFEHYLWDFLAEKIPKNAWQTKANIAAKSLDPEDLSKELKSAALILEYPKFYTRSCSPRE